MNVAIAGGGIIGLSIALELAGRGHDVRVFDSGEPARAASWAAAGMLAPRTEHLEEHALQAMCERSLDMYPSFAQRVAESSGIDPHLRLDGILHAAYDDDAAQRLFGYARELQGRGVRADVLDAAALRREEPMLSDEACGGILVHGEGSIDNRRLGKALVEACTRYAVRIETGVREIALEFNSRRVLGLRTPHGFCGADAVINAAGAWAAQLPGVPPECVPAVRPVKGQMLALQLPGDLLRRTTWVPGAYLVPRKDGRVLIGATMENASNLRVTSGAVGMLLGSALRALPSLGAYPIAEMWAGLRPGTADGLPFIGPTAREGYFLATGHFRNGILLAPYTAAVMADALETVAAKA